MQSMNIQLLNVINLFNDSVIKKIKTKVIKIKFSPTQDTKKKKNVIKPQLVYFIIKIKSNNLLVQFTLCYLNPEIFALF